MFIIQIRPKNNVRGIDILNSAGDAKEWINYQHQFEDIEKAQKECEILISSGRYMADDIRILEVVCTFSSKVEVVHYSKR